MEARRAGVPSSSSGRGNEQGTCAAGWRGGGKVGVCIHVHVCINHRACGGGSGWGRALLGIRHRDRGD